MKGHLPHPVTPLSDSGSMKGAGKKRGGYNCGRCGLPKKGHVCSFGNQGNGLNPNPKTTTTMTMMTSTPFNKSGEEFGFPVVSSSHSVVRLPHQEMRQPSNLRRALSFDDIDVQDSMEVENDGVEEVVGVDPQCGSGGTDTAMPPMYLWEVLRRLPPQSLALASGVCREWRDTAKMVWVAAEEIRLKVPVKAPVGFVGSVLQKCSGLVRLSLRMESDVDSMTLACIAFSCPNLESVEISMFGEAFNRITGNDLGLFVGDRRCLSNLKLEGCSNVGSLVLSSTSLCKLWLSDLYSLSKTVLNCPNLREISLDFSRLENDSTDLTTMVGSLGRSCPSLQRVNIASIQLSNSVVLALTAANLRGLRMLSLVLGSEITDASVAAIASVYSNLELLDLSGSSITDSGIGMICNVFQETLSSLLLAVCPNITSSGIQFAAAQLPYLELMDCGMSICDPNFESETPQDHIDSDILRTPTNKVHLIYQKLIIKHSRLKKLSLWGCSGLDALYLNCPQLFDLNLNSCSNLHPESLLLQCPNLECVHVVGCEDMLLDALQSQVCGNTSAMQNNFSRKRLPDGSKRVQAQLFCEQTSEDPKKRRRVSEKTRAVLIK
ncbi:hypothetical protein LIER_11489 [Lithospermum erythrorhizon]|uniref:F-box domain-containing protein n=1 Tax=Lithospermum erythrorhizon TaxID=34254 RepID=A0AAV3PN64_LITER